MAHAPDVHSQEARDELLARLLAGLTEDKRHGQCPDVEAVARRHPELADELRQLWAVVQFADEFGRSTGEGATTIAKSVPTPAGPDLPASPLPRLFGDYELLEELGRGGMGIVYKARQRSLNRIVALKMILRAELASPADLVRFQSEARAAARLDHPNIVPVYEVGECDGQPYFSMRFIEGRTLATRIAEGPLPPRDAAQLLVTICRAVDHAHKAGILHRDLKPSNVLLDREGRPHVTDFGLAKRVEGGQSLTRTGDVVGTPSYMAPEQAAGRRGTLSPAADVYSLGTILYEMLTGRPPFQAASAVDTLLLVLEQEPVPPRLLNRKVDRELELITLKCLQKPPDLRYRSSGELADDLEAFMQGERTVARPSGFAFYFSRMLRETHHAAILENWGVLWMWHSLALLVLCSTTNVLYLAGVKTVWPYLGLWGLGLGTWAAIFWALRRRGGPVTFVERQIAHVWGASTLGSMSLFGVEVLLGLDVLKLSPVLAILAGMVFLVKAGMLSGSFYWSALASFVTAVLMARFPSVSLFLFGAVSAACFFIPGLKYYRQRNQAERSIISAVSRDD